MGKRLFFSTLSAAVVAVSLTGQAWGFADDDARRAILELRQQVKSLTEQVAALQSNLAVMQNGQVSLLDKFAQYDVRQRDLTGRVEEVNNQVSRQARDMKTLYQNVDERLIKLEPVNVNINGETVAVAAPEHAAFTRIEALMTQNRADEAAPLMSTFLSTYPSSVYGPQVGYWQATVAFEKNQYRQTIDLANSVIRMNARSVLVPDAMLLVGAAQASLGNFKAAKATFEKVIERYPNTSQANTAKERLRLFSKKK